MSFAVNSGTLFVYLRLPCVKRGTRVKDEIERQDFYSCKLTSTTVSSSGDFHTYAGTLTDAFINDLRTYIASSEVQNSRKRLDWRLPFPFSNEFHGKKYTERLVSEEGCWIEKSYYRLLGSE